MAKTIRKIITVMLSFLFGAIAGTSLMLVKSDLFSQNQGKVVNHNAQLSVGEFFWDGIMLTAMAEETSNTSVRLTATIMPIGASIQTVDWNAAWKDDSSEWASGKNVLDYIMITPVKEGGLTADVACRQAFGEQILINVVSRDNPTLTASCVVDYAKRIDKVNFSLQPNNQEPHSTTEDTLMLTFNFSKAFMIYEYNTSYEYSTGTIEDVYELTGTFYVNYDEEVFVEIEKETGHSYTVIESYIEGVGLGATHYIKNMFRVNGSLLSTKDEEVTLLQKYFYDHPESVSKVFSMRMKVEGVYSTFEKDFAISFYPDALYVPAESIEVDQSAITL